MHDPLAVQPIPVDIRLIRAVLGSELRIVPGRGLLARVVSADGNGRGALSIAGALVDAELPEQVQAGQELRLVVREVSESRVVLSLADQLPPPPPAPVELPGGGSLRVNEEDEPGGPAGAAAPGSQRLSLRYDAPSLGPVDLRFELDAGSLRVVVALTPGEPLQLGEEGADQLQAALRTALNRAVSVTVAGRREPLDLYA
jgi:hypothetical protein